IYVNPTGNPGMASGGMGDVLAGKLAARFGQGFFAEDAMKLGGFLHGFVCGRMAGEKNPNGMIAAENILRLPAGMRALASAEPAHTVKVQSSGFKVQG